MAENAASEAILTTISSSELGLSAGKLEDLNVAVAKLPREQLTARTVVVLTGLEADLDNGGRNVSLTLAKELDTSHPLRKALVKKDAVFVEPLQQLVLLRRSLTVSGSGTHDITSTEGIDAYVDACRYASDLVAVTTDENEGAPIDGSSASRLPLVSFNGHRY